MSDRTDRVRAELHQRAKNLNPPLSETEVQAFEKRHHVRLPGAYREYLLELGNGGDGPAFYGVPPLGKVPQHMGPEYEAAWRALPNVGKPFPFTKPWVWESGDVSQEGSEEQLTFGNVCVGDDGCGQYWLLVVTGADRGCLWQICGEGIVHTVPKRDFLAWYEDWLKGVENWWEE